jgi:uncharacterized protein YkwD
MGSRPTFALLLLLTAGPLLVGCGGGAPLAEAERHLAAGRLERAADLLDAHSGASVDALRARIQARAEERALALARIDEIEREREGRAHADVLDELRALVVAARDPFVREHAEVALSKAYDWAAEQRSLGERGQGDRTTSTARASRVGGSTEGSGPPALLAPTDPLAAAAWREFDRHVKAKDWRSALGLAERWSDSIGADPSMRAAFDAWRSAALVDATREADELVVRAWRLDEVGERAAAVALLASAVDRFPATEEGAADSPVGGVARALAELSGFSTRPGTDPDVAGSGGSSEDGRDALLAGADGDAVRKDTTGGDKTGEGAPAAGDSTAGAAPAGGAAAPREGAEVASTERPAGGRRDGSGRSASGAEDRRGGAAARAPGGGGNASEGSRPGGAGLSGGALTGGALTGGVGREGRTGPPDVGADARELASAPLLAARDALVQARSTAERDAAFATLFAASKTSSIGRELLAEALTGRFQRAVVRLDRLGSLRRLERVADQRRELDLARERALALIFDEVRYFYPYTSPPVSADQAAQYPAVQREVDALVEAVREVWDGSPNARIPDPLRSELPELAWLRRREPLVPGGLVLPEKYPAWLEALPHDLEEVDLRSFAWRSDEARELARSRAIEARNEQLWAAYDAERASGEFVPTAEEREQVRVTNEYRAMMGRRALAWHPALNSAARGHSVYMSTTGDFGHHEPTQERHSPFDRMRLVGYTRGVSENCHMGSAGAEGAHLSWLSSSGHHRNLLMAGHREMASAVTGGYWTQNFGLDTSFEQHLDLRGWRD